jgi:hypothetical protein
MSRPGVLFALLLLVVFLVCVDQRSVVVLMRVILRPVRELSEWTAGVMV